MNSGKLAFGAWISVLVALLLWAGFVLLVWQLSNERARYAALKADAGTQEGREKASSELRALIRDTRLEREAVDQLGKTDLLAVAATIEAVGRVAGVEVTIGEATTAPISGLKSNTLNAVVIVASAEGKIDALMNAATLFESLPFPSTVESYSIEHLPAAGTRSADKWRMVTKIRVITPSESGT